jgi:hypothetical protein
MHVNFHIEELYLGSIIAQLAVRRDARVGIAGVLRQFEQRSPTAGRRPSQPSLRPERTERSRTIPKGTGTVQSSPSLLYESG